MEKINLLLDVYNDQDPAKVDKTKLLEHIPDFGQFSEEAQTRVIDALETGANVYITRMRAVHPANEKDRAGRILAEENGLIKSDDTKAIVVDWNSGRTNGAYVLLNDPEDRLTLKFHNDGFNIINKGSEYIANGDYHFTDLGVSGVPGKENPHMAIIQHVSSNSPRGANFDLTEFSKAQPDHPTSPALMVMADSGSNIVLGADTYGVEVLIDGRGKVDSLNPTNIQVAPANVSAAEIRGQEIHFGNSTQPGPTGNTRLIFMDDREPDPALAPPPGFPTTPSNAYITVKPNANGVPPAIVPLREDGKDGFEDGPRLEAALHKAAEQAAQASGGREPQRQR